MILSNRSVTVMLRWVALVVWLFTRTLTEHLVSKHSVEHQRAIPLNKNQGKKYNMCQHSDWSNARCYNRMSSYSTTSLQSVVFHGSRLHFMAAGCVSWQPVAFRSSRLHFVAAGCVSWQPVAFRGSRLRFVAAGCVSWQPVVFHGSRLRFMAAGCVSWQLVAFHGSRLCFMADGCFTVYNIMQTNATECYTKRSVSVIL